MPTKRTPRMRGRHVIELRPAVAWFLMTGTTPTDPALDADLSRRTGALRGWLDRLKRQREGTLPDVIAAHGDAMRAEGKRYGFVPWFVWGVSPNGNGFQRWADAFLRQQGS